MLYSSPKSLEETALIPVAITVFNLFPPNENAATSRLFRPEHTARLLVQTRLDIYRQETFTDRQGVTTMKDIVFFSAKLDQPSVHPSWYHLEDRIKPEQWDLAPKIRVVILGGDKETILIDDMSLLLSNLRQLPEDNDDQLVSWGQPHHPPKALPINSVVIQYSDGSTRVHPSLYQLLLQRNIIEEVSAVDLPLLEEEDEESGRALRFEDKMFTELDKVVCQIHPAQSSLLETVNEALVSPITNLINEYEVENEQSISSILECEVRELQSEKIALEAIIEDEQRLLEFDTNLFNQNKDGIREIFEQIQSIEKETQDIRVYAAKVLDEQKDLDLVVEGQRIKLLKELRAIYPIQCKPEHHYFIRGIELPSELHVGLVTEDEISAALGYICHSLVMMSKYLSIPLRYRIVCNSSRSAVQEDGATILPLFQSRLVERDLLDRGMALLDRNVEMIAKSREIRCGETSHILAKMKRIYDKIVDGR